MIRLPGPASAARTDHPGAERVPVRGGTVLVRPLERHDAALVAECFAQLSDNSRYLRFLTLKRKLSTSELARLTEVDHHDHEALAAIDPRSGRCVAIARFVRLASDRHAADLSVEVADAWHRRGVARALLDRLVRRAAQEGIVRLTATVSADNRPIRRLIRTLDGVRTEAAVLDAQVIDFVLRLELPLLLPAAEILPEQLPLPRAS